ncbi:MAG: terpene cyclase/mutase family protein [archaeon]|nr:terpene cyclase/mutase family protein [archaeon]
MKKIFIAVFFAIFLHAVFAEEMNVQVSFNFPLEESPQDALVSLTVPNDSNAFTAITKAAEQAGLELEITFYGNDAFIECIEELCTTQNGNDWMFWLFSVNNRPSGIGVSDYYAEEGDVLSLDYFEWQEKDALEWLFDRQEEDGKIGANSFQHAFALAALSLANDQNITGYEPEKNSAIQYLLSTQQDDAGFGDDLRSAVSVMALLSNGEKLSDFEVNGQDTLETITSHQQTDGGFRSGTNQSDVDTTSWAIIAFAEAGQNLPENNSKSPIDFLLSAQHENGSFGYIIGDEAESIDFTEEALIALSASKHQKDAQVQKSISWLSEKQDQDGCIEDGFRTALGTIAFLAWDENALADHAVECIESILDPMQNGDGSFGRGSNPSNAMDTGIAVIALSGKIFPLSVSDDGDENGSGDGNFGFRSIAKFTARIKNESNVSAQNVNIALDGVPREWIIDEESTLHFDEIKTGETVEAEIFVRMLEAGEYTVLAIVSTDTAAKDFESNNVHAKVEEALLSVGLFVGG